MYRTVYPEGINSLIQYDNYIPNIYLSGITIIEYLSRGTRFLYIIEPILKKRKMCG
jgi:hypothetical protein